MKINWSDVAEGVFDLFFLGLGILIGLYLGAWLNPMEAEAATIVESSTGVDSLTITTQDGDVLVVHAKAALEQGSFGNMCVMLNMGGTQMDVTCTDDDNFSANARYAYPLQFTTEPGATTTTITLTDNFGSGSVADQSIIAEIISPDSGGGAGGLSTDPVLNSLVAAFLVIYTANYVRRLFYS